MEKINWTDFKGVANPLSEGYRIIRANLQNAADKKRAKALVFTAPNSVTDTDFVTAALGVVLAQAGQKILIIDCNLLHPRQHNLFDLPNHGLVEGVVGDEDLYTMVQHCMEQERLDVLTAGTSVQTTEEILLSERMQEFLVSAREAYDYILLAMPCIEQGIDAITMGPKADGVVLVVTSMEDKIREVNDIKNKLEMAGAHVLGCILS